MLHRNFRQLTTCTRLDLYPKKIEGKKSGHGSSLSVPDQAVIADSLGMGTKLGTKSLEPLGFDSSHLYPKDPKATTIFQVDPQFEMYTLF